MVKPGTSQVHGGTEICLGVKGKQKMKGISSQHQYLTSYRELRGLGEVFRELSSSFSPLLVAFSISSQAQQFIRDGGWELLEKLSTEPCWGGARLIPVPSKVTENRLRCGKGVTGQHQNLGESLEEVCAQHGPGPGAEGLRDRQKVSLSSGAPEPQDLLMTVEPNSKPPHSPAKNCTENS